MKRKNLFQNIFFEFSNFQTSLFFVDFLPFWGVFLKVPLQKWCWKKFFPTFFFWKLDLNQIFRCLTLFSSNFEQKIFFSKYFFRIFKFSNLIFFCRFFTSLRGQNDHLGGDLNFFFWGVEIGFWPQKSWKKMFFQKNSKASLFICVKLYFTTGVGSVTHWEYCFQVLFPQLVDFWKSRFFQNFGIFFDTSVTVFLGFLF